MKTITVKTNLEAIALNEQANNKRNARIEAKANKFVAKTLKNITKNAKSGMGIAWSPKVKKGTPVNTVMAKLEARGFTVNMGNEYIITRETHWKEVLLTRKFGLNKN